MKSILFKLCLIAGSSMFIFGNCNKSSDAPGENFAPITTGSTFTYLNTPGGPYTLTVTSRDTVALTHTYKVLSNSSGGSNYLAKIGSDYYRFGVFPTLSTTGFEELYLKDGQSVNGTWTATQNISAGGLTIPATLTYVVKEKGVARTVATKAYTNVIHIRLDITVTGLGNLGGGDFYYAANIGLIEGNLTVTVPGQPSTPQSQVLTSYNIK